MKPLMEIWSSVINKLDAFKNNQLQNKNFPVKLDKYELIDLYEIMEYDKDKVLESYLKGQDNNPDDKFLELDITISEMYIIFTEKDQVSDYSVNKFHIH